MINLKKTSSYIPFEKIVIPINKTHSIADSKTGYVYDLRHKLYFDELKIPGSVHIKLKDIKEKILEHRKKDKIVLVGHRERSHADIASWSRKQKYNNILILEKGMDNLSEMEIKGKNK